MSSESERVSKGAVIAMSAIIFTVLLVAIYSNWQNAHRDKVESATTIYFTPSPSPSVTP